MDYSRMNPAYKPYNEPNDVPVHKDDVCTVQQRPNNEVTVLWVDYWHLTDGSVVGSPVNQTEYTTNFIGLLALLARINMPTQFVVLGI